MSSPKVTIVIPTYNRAHLLPPVIESITQQDYPDFDLLIVDDGSTDNTAEVIRPLAEADPRIRYFPLPRNGGIGYARHAGANEVHTPYMALGDSDDLWVPGRLKRQMDILERHPEIDILFGDFLNIDHVNGTEELAFVESRAGMQYLRVRELEPGLFLIEDGVERGILYSNFIGAPTIVMRTDVIERIGNFDVRLSTPVDLEFGWRAAAMKMQFAYLDAPMIYRHRYTDSATANGIQAFTQRLTALDICQETARTINRPDLLEHIHHSQVRSYRNLIRLYGEQQQRGSALRSYARSLRIDRSSRTALLLGLALLGPSALNYAQHTRFRSSS
ncbi:MAG: glycosyltransferase family 2 protein [Anaerolineae bacterium]|nr:glycosyltransferase family 2 protein [Anaerolineae bacterium]